MSNAVRLLKRKRVTNLPRTWVKAMIAITCAGMCGVALLEQYFPDEEPGTYKIRRLCARALTQAQDAAKLWGTVRDERTLDLLGKEVLAFRKNHVGDSVHCTEMTSIASGLLDDLSVYLDTQEKVDAIDRLINTVWEIHAYLEKNGQNHEYYSSAGRKVEEWKGVMG